MLKLLRFYKPFTRYIILTVLLMFGQAVSELFLPTLMSNIVNKGMITGNTSVVLQYGAPMICVALVSFACALSSSYFSAMVSVGVSRDLRSAVFTKAESFSLNEYDKFGAASLITRTTNDVAQIQQSLIMVFRFMVYSPLMCIGGFIMAFSKNKEMTVILSVSVPAIIFLIVTVGRIALPLFRAMQKKIDRLNLVAREGLTGVRVIRAFNREGYDQRRFDDASKDLLQNSVKVNRLMSLLMPSIMMVMNLTAVAVIWFGGHKVAAGNMNLGDVMAFLQYSSMIMFSFVMISMMFIMLPRASASAERINEALETQNSIKEPEKPVVPKEKRGIVEFKNVSFRYEGAENPVLNNISFTAMPGKTTAVIGGTGSGKTTLVSLIPRFYDVTGGEVLVDGINVSDMSQSDLRQMIGYVPQKAVLFSDTIAGNIRMGNANATDEDIAKAAETAQAEYFISKLDDGFNHEISQGGTNVSGGQRQRLSIARALVRKPPIYIFDDSFSALDMKTDANLRSALKKETQSSTLIIVAQRLSSILDADNIIVLDNGEICGMGTHAQLIESCAVYREIAESQS